MFSESIFNGSMSRGVRLIDPFYPVFRFFFKDQGILKYLKNAVNGYNYYGRFFTVLFLR